MERLRLDDLHPTWRSQKFRALAEKLITIEYNLITGVLRFLKSFDEEGGYRRNQTEPRSEGCSTIDMQTGQHSGGVEVGTESFDQMHAADVTRFFRKFADDLETLHKRHPT